MFESIDHYILKLVGSKKVPEARCMSEQLPSFNYVVDTPKHGILEGNLIHFSGWMLTVGYKHSDISILINGKAADFIQYFTRPDLPIPPNQTGTGWSVYFEIDKCRTPGSPAIVVDFEANGIRLGTEYFRLADRTSIPAGIFLHIAKTGGSTTRAQIEKFDKLIKLVRVYSDIDALHPEQVPVLSPKSWDEVDIVFGHFSHGRYMKRPTEYYAMVRNPFDRLLSEYFFRKYDRRESQLQNNSIAYFLDHCAADNVLVRHISGVGLSKASMTEHDFDRACKNIEGEFAFIGLYEYFSHSMARLSRCLGLNLIRDLPHINPTMGSAEKHNLDIESFRRQATSKVELDLRLYDFIAKRFWGGLVASSHEATPAVNNLIGRVSGLERKVRVRGQSNL